MSGYWGYLESGIRRGEPFVLTNELVAALLLIGFQIIFHVLYPVVRLYWFPRDSGKRK